MFRLKDKNKTKTSIIINTYISEIGSYFRYATGLSIETDLWDNNTQRPIKARGNKHPHLKPIELKLDSLKRIFEEYMQDLDSKNILFNKADCKAYLDKTFKYTKLKSIPKSKPSAQPKYLLAFFKTFIKQAPNKINRNTNKPYSEAQIKKFKQLYKRLEIFEQHRKKKMQLQKIDQQLYDELYVYWQSDQKYSINTIGFYFKNLRSVLKVAEKDYKFVINQEFKEKEFAVVEETSLSIALRESEIDLIFNHDFSDTPYLENARAWAIIGLWMGLRISDFMEINLTPETRYYELEPDKTSNYDIKVIIPIHHQIKAILSNYGMPHRISDQKFNDYFKEVCKQVGLNEIVKGSLMNPETKRKEVGMYEKYKLVSSHTCRRSFATNMYLMSFPTLSIMKITGHKTEKSFLKYIKVTPKEHAEKLLAHWEEYYNKKSTNL